MNLAILQPEVQDFINSHLGDDVTKIALAKSPFMDVSSKELAEQVDSKKRSQKKLPLWFNTSGIYFPPKLSIEQSSSALTATYKSKLIKGDRLVDLTGGFGVDAFYFSTHCKHVFHCELNQELSAIATYNTARLGATNIKFINSDSIQYLRETGQKFDTIYVDPSRRIQSKKVFLLKDTEPDVVANLPLLFSKATRVLIKTSPLFDIQSGLKELTNVSEIHILSIKNDCKELLWVLDKDFTGEPEIICAALSDTTEKVFRFPFSGEKLIESSTFSPPLKYLYEPDVALLKGGAFKRIAIAFQLFKLQTNTHLYTSDNLVEGFIGKTFSVIKTLEYKAFAKENAVKKVNVSCRNFPHSPEEVKKKHKLIDGGDDFLIFTTIHPKQLVVIVCKLV